MAVTSKSKIHHSRYIRKRIGIEVAEIAKADKVTIETVQKSINMVEAYRACHTIEFVNEAIMGLIMENTGPVSKAIAGGLGAKLELEGAKGQKVTVPDHAMRMRAVDSFTKLVETVQPKAKTGGVSVSVQQTAAALAAAPTETSLLGFEDKLKVIRRKIQEQEALPSEVGTPYDDEAELADDDDEEAPAVIEAEAVNDSKTA